MPIELNRDEVIRLIQELPVEHFLQPRLAHELVAIVDQPNTTVRAENHLAPVLSPRSVARSAEDRFGSREVIAGRLVVSKPDLGENEFTDKQLDEMYEAGGVAPKKQCKWQTYGYRCRETSTNEFCDEHLNQKCSHKDSEGAACGNKADHGCPTELQFVCGAPCCSGHSNCGNHNRSWGLGN